MKKIIWFLIGCCFGIPVISQTLWDDVQSKKWPQACQKVNVSSSADGSLQPAILYSARQSAQPLIVSLHTWSGDYAQEDSLIIDAIGRDWNYIHPNFRGANNTIQACGSELAVQDIDDAIRFAIKQTGANPAEVHLIGASGGGYMALMCYMKLKYPAKSFSSWVGISDLEAWYYESIGRGHKYANDILQCTGSGSSLNVALARARSPIYQAMPNRQATLHLYAGIHDGYLGSVPITQTIKMFNKIVQHLYPKQPQKLVSNTTMLSLVTQRNSGEKTTASIGNRGIHLYKKEGPVSLVVFEGKHEMIVEVGLQMIPVGKYYPFGQKNILAIGDSNGALQNGWVDQLKNIQPGIQLLNHCKSGRTIGFDNNNDTSLNELRLIKQQLQEAYHNFGKKMDVVILALGTNDTKAIFADSQHLIIPRFEYLLQQIEDFKKAHRLNFQTIVLLPPPIEEMSAVVDKYSGAEARLKLLHNHMKGLLSGKNVRIVDAYQLFINMQSVTYDGVHLTRQSQQLLARQIAAAVYL